MRRIAEPAIEPITAAEVDAYLRGNGNLIGEVDGFISAAVRYFETTCGVSLITQTWLIDVPKGRAIDIPWWDGLREGSLKQFETVTRSYKLPYGPIQRVTEIDGQAASGVQLRGDSAQLPSSAESVQYVAGYGDAATDVPADIRHCLKQLAGHWYENRELTKTQSDEFQAATPVHLISLMNRHKRHGL